MKIAIFEDEGYKNLCPLVFTRPVFDLQYGTNTLFKKIKKQYPGKDISLHIRPYLTEITRRRHPDCMINTFKEDLYLFINSRIKPGKDILSLIDLKKANTRYTWNGEVVYALVDMKSLDLVPQATENGLDISFFNFCKEEKSDVELFSYIWDLINTNHYELEREFNEISALFEENHKKKRDVHPGAYVVNPSGIYLGKGTKIMPGVVLDASEGRIFIDEGVTVYPNSIIMGPVFIGANTQIKAAAQIYGGTSVGDVCKIGGEVHESIFYSYSNKQHDGFIGNSYVGQWVNIGAGATFSNLKNNYSNVRVHISKYRLLDSKNMFLGGIMADHSKIGINTMFNSGTTVGVSCNVFGGGFQQKYIPSFIWGDPKSLQEYKLEKGLETARRVMSRRNVTITQAEIDLLKVLYDRLSEERIDLY